jgi:methionyl aminopeptidase
VEPKDKENYLKAGEILKKVQVLARKEAKIGAKYLDLAEKIEGEIASLGGKPAFPVNLSNKEIAAHYTPSIDDETVIEKEDLLKVDIGVHVEGFIADAAFTVDFSGKNGKLVEASEKALANAVEVIDIGVELKDIGKVIEETINSYGFKPVKNLSGHGLLPFMSHAAPSIPNVENRDDRVIEEDMVIAIEPFATDGEGWVRESSQSEIFQLDEPKPVRNMAARKILEKAAEEYLTLPFAERWFGKEGAFQRKIGFRELMLKKCVKAFPVLKEEEGRLVSQAETSILFDGKEKIILV